MKLYSTLTVFEQYFLFLGHIFRVHAVTSHLLSLISREHRVILEDHIEVLISFCDPRPALRRWPFSIGPACVWTPVVLCLVHVRPVRLG